MADVLHVLIGGAEAQMRIDLPAPALLILSRFRQWLIIGGEARRARLPVDDRQRHTLAIRAQLDPHADVGLAMRDLDRAGNRNAQALDQTDERGQGRYRDRAKRIAAGVDLQRDQGVVGRDDAAIVVQSRLNLRLAGHRAPSSSASLSTRARGLAMRASQSSAWGLSNRR